MYKICRWIYVLLYPPTSPEHRSRGTSLIIRLFSDHLITSILRLSADMAQGLKYFRETQMFQFCASLLITLFHNHIVG